MVLLFALASSSSEGEEQWKRAAEEIMAGVVLGPLRPGFGPETLAKRTREGALRAQTNRLRARVVVAMVEALDEHVDVCVLEHTHADAARAVVDELRAHNFTGAAWMRDGRKCPHGFIHVEVPPPATEK